MTIYQYGKSYTVLFFLCELQLVPKAPTAFNLNLKHQIQAIDGNIIILIFKNTKRFFFLLTEEVAEIMKDEKIPEDKEKRVKYLHMKYYYN